MSEVKNEIEWKRDGGDYVSKCGTFKIVKMPAWANAYSNNDAWTLVDVASNDGIDVFDYLRDAKKAALVY